MNPMLWPTLVLVLAALPLAAQPGRGLAPGQIARTLDLSEAQRSSLRSIREKHRPELQMKRDAARRARADLRAALGDLSVPEVRLRALHDQVAAAQFELRLARRSVRSEVQAVLTPEQRERAAALQALARERRRERLRHADLERGLAG